MQSTFFSVSRDKSGRYIVRLSFRESNAHLGDSRSIALKQLSSLERKFNANGILKDEYTRTIEEHIRLKHILLIRNPNIDGYYMSHHAVIKKSSNTKIRIVFDASVKTNKGVSLNDTDNRAYNLR